MLGRSANRVHISSLSTVTAHEKGLSGSKRVYRKAVKQSVLQTPRNFFSFCNETVSKRFKQALKEVHDEFCKLGIVDKRKANFNIACGEHAFEKMAAMDITNSFHVTGIFSSQRKFPRKFKSTSERDHAEAETECENLRNTGLGTGLLSVVKLRSDNETTVREMRWLLQPNSDELSCEIQKVSVVLQHAETLNCILVEGRSKLSTDCGTTVSETEKELFLYDPGGPAKWVTVNRVERRRQKDVTELQARLEGEVN